MNIELPYERQAMQSNIIPSDLCGADVLMFMALHGLYAAARDKKISREQGAAYKKMLLRALAEAETTKQGALYYGKLMQCTEIAKTNARKNPCKETALALAECLDSRGWEKLTEVDNAE